MRPLTWALNATVVVGVLLSAVASAAPAERAVNGTTIINEVARRALTPTTPAPSATIITANPGRAKESVMSSRSSVKSSISPATERQRQESTSEAIGKERWQATTHEDDSEREPKVTSFEEKRLRPEDDDEDNMVMSEQEARRLKPNQKKSEQQQHQRNIEKVLDEAQFDYEHYFDSIPSPSSSSSVSEGGSKADSGWEQTRGISLPAFEVPDAAVLQKILEFLGLEEFLVEHHLREADQTVNATLQQNGTNDDVLIVKSVKVNVRKV